ncbi:hypothetical protein G7Y89_g6926 [Cudoniella acicularis]|uniref:Uncharacterized protein n=1 Tax=Cudoniella acicularis TaxID=354080 RepID=A0A8H4RJH1_9HELO|nr:hypothetical protein G7Y89_g6926 [Cudoniella acicularis]
MATTAGTADTNGASTSHNTNTLSKQGKFDNAGTGNYNANQGQSQGRDFGDYGGNPLAHANKLESAHLPAFGGNLQPSLYRDSMKAKSLGNPAPLGLCGFALTTFVLSLINFNTMGVGTSNVVVDVAFGYGGLVQLLAGM